MIQLKHAFHYALKVSDFLKILMHFSQISLANNLFAKRLKRVENRHVSVYMCLAAQSCPTLCDSIDCNPPSTTVHGGSPGRNTGVGCHVFMPSSRGSSQPRD